MISIEILFWFSLVGIIYPYLIYPSLLWILSKIILEPVKKDDITPFVSSVISAYNEESIIAKKIENSLDLDYPKDLIEIAVISDGSTDLTNNIIQEYAKRNDRIRACITSVNKGKTSCLNDFVPILKGDIILFTDANAFFDRNVIYNIVRPFADPEVGFVTGVTKYIAVSKNRTVEAVDLYSKLETYIKRLESKIGSCIGADGAIFAIRKNLFVPMKPYDINDLAIPMSIIKQGYRGIVEKDAFCKEQATEEIAGEFDRQVRITARTLRAIFNYKILLNPFRYPIISFEIFSHKLMKFMAPFWIILIFVANIYLAATGILFYQATMVLQIFFYFISATGFLEKKNSRKGRLLNLSCSYLAVNSAYALGWLKYLKGNTYTSWLPKR